MFDYFERLRNQSEVLKQHSYRGTKLFIKIAMQVIMESILIITRETEMDKMSEEDRKRILESPPVGTFALMSVVIGGMVVAWLFLYYGVFLPRG